MQLWEASSGKLLLRYQGHSMVVAIAWSPDGKFLASGGHDKTVQVWDATSGRLLHRFEGYSYRDRSTIAWSPNAHLLASIGLDNTTRVWDITNGNNTFTYRGHTGLTTAVAWSSDGEKIASTGYQVHIWKAPR